MRNKIAFVAVGQAGGNIGQLFEAKGYNVLYIFQPTPPLREATSSVSAIS